MIVPLSHRNTGWVTTNDGDDDDDLDCHHDVGAVAIALIGSNTRLHSRTHPPFRHNIEPNVFLNDLHRDSVPVVVEV